jgi:hypothetical protein
MKPGFEKKKSQERGVLFWDERATRKQKGGAESKRAGNEGQNFTRYSRSMALAVGMVILTEFAQSAAVDQNEVDR